MENRFVICKLSDLVYLLRLCFDSDGILIDGFLVELLHDSKIHLIDKEFLRVNKEIMTDVS